MNPACLYLSFGTLESKIRHTVMEILTAGENGKIQEWRISTGIHALYERKVNRGKNFELIYPHRIFKFFDEIFFNRKF